MFRKKKQFTHFERDNAGVVTDVRRYDVTGGTKEEPIPDLEPIDEIEADTDVKAMIRESKQQQREQKRVELEAEMSMLHKKQEMKLSDLRQKKEMKELKGDIRKMKYAPLYKTGSGLVKMGKAVRERDSGFAGGGQDKVVLDEGAVGNGGNGKSNFFDFGSKGKVDFDSSKKTEMGLATGGSSKIDWGAKSTGKIDFSLGMGRSAPKKKRRKTTTKRKKPSGTKKKAKRRKK